MLSFILLIVALLLIVLGFVLVVCATSKWNDRDQDKVSLKMMRGGYVVTLVGGLLGIIAIIIK